MIPNAFLEVARHVIGIMSEPFVPSVHMKASYGNHLVSNGRYLRTLVVCAAPSVTIDGDPNALYTLVMIDPDVPNPYEPTSQDFVSWIVINIPGGTSCAQGTEFLSYNAPKPDIGVHRHVFVLYKQQSRLDGIETLPSRICFKTRDFAEKHNLGYPVNLSYFNTKKEIRKRQLMA
uniref:protein MOTHER of FT and TFL1 homolog 2-like n=1 Tax=Erigeron canadensis TaxID=72917 RepID=UPI001CB9C302|nr:protein MOTHER of FT and TFL1 homolog 2-like [Erigeron canadensis]